MVNWLPNLYIDSSATGRGTEGVTTGSTSYYYSDNWSYCEKPDWRKVNKEKLLELVHPIYRQKNFDNMIGHQHDMKTLYRMFR